MDGVLMIILLALAWLIFWLLFRGGLGKVLRWVAQRAQGQPPQESAKDAWEDGGDFGPLLYSHHAMPLTAQLSFTFVDKEGQVTQRSVDTRKFVSDGSGGAIWAHCRLRNANRPFEMSRMSKVIDLETGEMISDLPRWALDRYEQTPHASVRAFTDEHDAALALLLSAARADGAMRAKERELIATWCRRHGLRDGAVPLLLKDISAWEKLSAVAIGRALRAVASRAAPYPAEVLVVMEAIVATDKNVREDETRLLERARKALMKPDFNH